MDLSKQRIQQTRDFLHLALANAALEFFNEARIGDELDIEELIQRWREQEDEILISLAADLAALHLEDAASKKRSKRTSRSSP